MLCFFLSLTVAEIRSVNAHKQSIDHAKFYLDESTVNYSIPRGTKTLYINGTGKTEMIEITKVSFHSGLSKGGLVTVIISEGITDIGYESFADCWKLTTIEIPESVTYIGSRAFYRCKSLVTIKLPSSLNRLDYEVFNGCINMTSIVLPQSLKQVDSYAFCNCTSLKTLEFPPNVADLGRCMCANDTSLEKLILPKNCIMIGTWAFVNCSKLTQIEIPSGLKTIEYSAFEGCLKLGEFTVDKDNKVFSAKDNILYNITKTEMYIIPLAIQGNIEIPNTIDVMGSFRTILNTFSISFEAGTKFQTTMVHWFSNSRLESIVIPKKITNLIEGSFRGCKDLKSVTFAGQVEAIGGYCFKDCINLEFQIPDSVRVIAQEAFAGCTKLTSITYPSKITYCNLQIFENCPNLNKFAFGLPCHFDNIGTRFLAATGIESIEIPDSIKDISSEAFMNCQKLVTVKLPPTLNKFLSRVFSHCTSIKEFNVPSGTTLIGEGTFEYCTGLVNLTFGKESELTVIERNAFSHCSKLQALDLPPKLKQIDSQVLNSNTNLKFIRLPASIKITSSNIFTNLTNITIYYCGSNSFSGVNLFDQSSLKAIHAVYVETTYKDNFFSNYKKEVLKELDENCELLVVPSPSASSPPTESPDDSDAKVVLGAGEIAGIVIGGIVIVAIIVAGIVYYVRKRNLELMKLGSEHLMQTQAEE